MFEDPSYCCDLVGIQHGGAFHTHREHALTFSTLPVWKALWLTGRFVLASFPLVRNVKSMNRPESVDGE